MLINWIIIGFLCLVSRQGGVYAYDHVISEQRDHKVLLSCPIDFRACGELHSVKWFKGNTRIAVVSGDGEVATVKDEFMSRMSIDHMPKGPVTSLSIKSLQIADEDIYTCESTFLEPRESCDTSGVYRIDLKVEVPPSAVHILDESEKFVKNGTKYGPLREGHKLKSICEVKATRPVPTVAWYRGAKRLTDSLHVDEENGLYYVKSELLLIVSRLELGNNIECRVESPSLDDEIITNYIQLDLEVPPTSINLTGVEHHTVQGTNVLLQCKVYGARPAVTIAWFNSSREIDIRHNDAIQIETKSIEQRDGTYETISDLKFVASRYEDGIKFRCEAQNIVMRDKKDKPLHESLVLEVLYPPVVSVKPENLTVKEGDEALLYCEYEANPATLVSVKWFQNGKQLNVSKSDRYEGGNPEHIALLIKESTRYDDGAYTCELANAVGTEISNGEIYVEVQFPPVVNLTMDPDTPMIENDEANVTLYCNVLEGNPPNLIKVRWFLGGQLLKELPECNTEDGDELCGIDPSRLLLQNIGRHFLGNYSCEGLNSAGWGARSKDNELIVYYEPGNATIQHSPQIAIKKKSVSFSCSVDDLGNPETTTYRWLRGGRVVHEVTSNQYTVDPVGLDSRTNFTCYAFNAGGNGNSATILLDVHAAPSFINPLMPYTGVLYSTNNASLTCRVECVPRCSISWFKDGVGIDDVSNKYHITEKYLDADPATGDFESALSVLNFNMSAWPQEKFDIYGDNANYSCVSTNNSAGLGVRSATYFGIEYTPENTTVSKDIVTVEEDNIPERILCTAKGNPEPLYEWQFNGSVITRGSALIINHKMAKSDAGPYECFAYNKHGRHSALTNITVIYKPTCEIIRKEIDDEDTLICTASGNPKESDFQWSIKSENDTVDLGSGRVEGESSNLILNDEFSVTRFYRCVANNSVGAGPYCQIEVAGHLSWWQRWDKITLIILVSTILGVLLAVITLCCVIVCMCRRRRKRDKYHTDVSISASQSVLSYQASPPPPPRPPSLPPLAPQTATVTATPHRSTPDIPKSPPKWPLRPGVMVHVKGNTKQNLCANRSNPLSVAASACPIAASAAVISTTTSSSAPSASSAILNSCSAAPSSPSSALSQNSNLDQIQSVAVTLLASSLSQPLSTLVAPLSYRPKSTQFAPPRPPPPSCGSGGNRFQIDARSVDCDASVITDDAIQIDTDSEVNHQPTPTTSSTPKRGAVVSPLQRTTTAPCNAHCNGTNNNNLTGEGASDDRPPPLPKRNILLSRNSTNANILSECSTNELLPRKGKRRRKNNNRGDDDFDEDDDDAEDSTLGCRPLQGTLNTDRENIAKSTATATGMGGNGGLFEKIFGEIFNRSSGPSHDNDNNVSAAGNEVRQQDDTDTAATTAYASNNSNFRNHLRNLFGISRIFSGRQRLQRNDSDASNPFDGEHRLKGIRCSGGVVTYKRTPIQKRTASDECNNETCAPTVNASRIEHNAPAQINNKSSALGDPLTEPGEYENLPFHGLQTAPNKFVTTPSINFNNANVVRVAPRPKHNTNSHSNPSQSYQLHQQQQQQSHYPMQQSSLKHSYPLSSSQTMLLSAATSAHGKAAVNSTSNHLNSSCSKTMSNVSSGHSRNYSLSNCFPTSYTAYYQQQQHYPTAGKSLNDSSFPTPNNCPYTVETTCTGGGSMAIHNPFIAQNLRKFNTNSSCRQGGHRKKPPDPEKKFYSLKSLGNRKGVGLHFCSIKPALTGNKCKRHHSFAGGSVGDIVTTVSNSSGSGGHSLPFFSQHSQHNPAGDIKMKFYEPPLYENLTDSIQIHESSMISNSGRPAGTVPSLKQQNHQHQQPQLNDDNNLMEPERLSIYRSDSGISNSSYECVTPVPAPRQLLKQKSSAGSSCGGTIIAVGGGGSASTTKCHQNHNSPLYMNVSNSNTNSNSQMPKASSSSLSSTSHHYNQSTSTSATSLPHHQQQQQSNPCVLPNASSNPAGNGNGSHCNGANKCNQTNNNSKDMQQLYCQQDMQQMQQQLHQQKDQRPHHHQQQQQHHPESQHAKHGSSNSRKCKKRTQNSASLLNLEQVSNTNPFLATGTSSSSGFNSQASGNGGGGASSSSSSSTATRCRQKSSQCSPQRQPLFTEAKDHNQSTQLTSSSSSSSTSQANPAKRSHNQLTEKSKRSQHDELFDVAGSTATNYNSDNNLSSYDLHYQKSNGYIIRPMKLPLRKHHSFHFQPSQTVTGSSTRSKYSNTCSNSNSIRNNYKMNGGPLVFKPLLNENSAFKPIMPAGNSNCSRDDNDDANSTSNTPRICGTSLKRHMSNVESYDSSRYRKNHSFSSPRLSVEDEEFSPNDEDEDNADEEIDEIIITQEEDPPSSSSNSTIVGKRLVYADLASLNPGRSNRNLRSNTTCTDSATIIDEFDDLTINSDSEQFRRSGNRRPIVLPYNGYGNSDRGYDANDVNFLGTPSKRRTQYASLKYNEVNI